MNVWIVLSTIFFLYLTFYCVSIEFYESIGSGKTINYTASDLSDRVNSVMKLLPRSAIVKLSNVHRTIHSFTFSILAYDFDTNSLSPYFVNAHDISNIKLEQIIYDSYDFTQPSSISHGAHYSLI